MTGWSFGTLSIVYKSPRSLRTNALSFSNVAAKLEFHDMRSPKGFSPARTPYPLPVPAQRRR
jgi:hypothetical protein